MNLLFDKKCRRILYQRLIGGAAALLVICSSAIAQTDGVAEVDTEAPVIEFDELETALAGRSQVFTVQIAEESELADATLYYRRSGEQGYEAIPLRPLGSSGFYSASITTDPKDLRTIEYYLQARDAAGNRTVSGFAFDPYSRSLNAPQQAPRVTQAPLQVEPIEVPSDEPPAVETPTTPTFATRQPFYKRRWVQVTAGVIVVGLVANSLVADGEDTRLVDVTFNVE